MSLKSPKSSKSSKHSKEKANIEFICKFRGKYDLSKNKNNNEISLDNAINLFDIISKKKESLYKNTRIKMYKEKKTFSFADQKSITKVHHRVPYIQVKKFFVFHQDPTIVIMGVHHKMHRWFLVFQFQNIDDSKKFCDEIEGEKKLIYEENENTTLFYDELDSSPKDIPEIQIEGLLRSVSPSYDPVKNNNTLERFSIHSEVYNEHLKLNENNFDDSCFELDLEPENFVSESSFIEESSRYSSRASSRNSVFSEFDERMHCDNISNSKLKDLLLSTRNVFYENIDEWDEELTCMEYPKVFNEPKFNKIGPVYIYSARHKITDEENIIRNYSGSLSSDEDDEDNFNHYKKKHEHFYNFEPKFFLNENNTNNFHNHEPKMNHSNLNNLQRNDPKMIKKKSNDDNFNNHDPKMIQMSNNAEDFKNYDPKIITNYLNANNCNNHDPKRIQNDFNADNFNNHDPKMIEMDNNADIFNDHDSKMIQMDNNTDYFNNHDPKMIQIRRDLDNFENHEPKMIY